jgi:hypothetical protein
MHMTALTAQCFPIVVHRSTTHHSTAQHIISYHIIAQHSVCADLFVWPEVDQLVLAVQVNEILHTDGRFGQDGIGRDRGKGGRGHK